MRWILSAWRFRDEVKRSNAMPLLETFLAFNDLSKAD